jgi:hypothetical protein
VPSQLPPAALGDRGSHFRAQRRHGQRPRHILTSCVGGGTAPAACYRSGDISAGASKGAPPITSSLGLPVRVFLSSARPRKPALPPPPPLRHSSRVARVATREHEGGGRLSCRREHRRLAGRHAVHPSSAQVPRCHELLLSPFARSGDVEPNASARPESAVLSSLPWATQKISVCPPQDFRRRQSVPRQIEAGYGRSNCEKFALRLAQPSLSRQVRLLGSSV